MMASRRQSRTHCGPRGAGRRAARVAHATSPEVRGPRSGGRRGVLRAVMERSRAQVSTPMVGRRFPAPGLRVRRRMGSGARGSSPAAASDRRERRRPGSAAIAVRLARRAVVRGVAWTLGGRLFVATLCASSFGSRLQPRGLLFGLCACTLGAFKPVIGLPGQTSFSSSSLQIKGAADGRPLHRFSRECLDFPPPTFRRGREPVRTRPSGLR